MDNLEKLESSMIRDVDEYVRTMDQFEMALNERTTKWGDRAKVARRLAAARNKTMNLIVTLIIAGAAVLITLRVLVFH